MNADNGNWSDPVNEPQIIVYPVGWMAVWRSRVSHNWRGEWRRMVDYIKRRHWEAVRNMFNGYLAEVQYSSMHHTRCGHGWTKRRALSDLGRHLGEMNR